MPKTPSQKRNTRRKRVSLGRQEENQARRRFMALQLQLKLSLPNLWETLRQFKHVPPLSPSLLSRFSKGKRSNLRGSSVKSLNFIAEEEPVPEASTSDANATTQPKRTTRKNKQRKSDVSEDVSRSPHGSCQDEEVENKKPEGVEEQETDKKTPLNNAEVEVDNGSTQSPPKIPSPEAVVVISSEERLSSDNALKAESSPGRTATKIAIAGAAQSSRRSSVRCSLKLRHSLAGLRHSMTQESVRRASRRSILKRRVSRMANSTCSNNNEG